MHAMSATLLLHAVMLHVMPASLLLCCMWWNVKNSPVRMHLMQTVMPWPEFSCWPTDKIVCNVVMSLLFQFFLFGTSDPSDLHLWHHWLHTMLDGSCVWSTQLIVHTSTACCMAASQSRMPIVSWRRQWRHTRRSGLHRSHAACSAWACSSLGTASCNILNIKTKHHCCSAPSSLMPGSSANFLAFQLAKGFIVYGWSDAWLVYRNP